MYGVNAGVPKTLIRQIVRDYADNSCSKNPELKAALYDILDTPVSPELIPPKDGEISQVTEDIVGPYELHDFYLYYFVRYGFTPEKILFLAETAFGDEYDRATLEKWMRNFVKRFITQQFKRSCLPDGPKIGSVSLSPRGDWKMPSDASFNVWNF
jgi:NAD+ synthase (glutamine-hydrolysing)